MVRGITNIYETIPSLGVYKRYYETIRNLMKKVKLLFYRYLFDLKWGNLFPFNREGSVNPYKPMI